MSIRGSKHPPPFVTIRVHSWFKTHPLIRDHSCPFVVQNSGTQVVHHPSPPSPLPFQGRGVPRGDLGLNPYPPRTHLIRVQAPSHSCLFVFIRGSKYPRLRVHSWFPTPPPFVAIRGHSWFKTPPPFVFIRGSKYPSIRGSIPPHNASTPSPDVQNAPSSANLPPADSTEPAATTNTQLSSR